MKRDRLRETLYDTIEQYVTFYGRALIALPPVSEEDAPHDADGRVPWRRKDRSLRTKRPLVDEAVFRAALLKDLEVAVERITEAMELVRAGGVR